MSVMFKVLARPETQDLMLQLYSELPGSAKMYYILCNHYDQLLVGFEVIVDKWPDWSSALLRPVKNQEVPGYFQHYYMCHTRSSREFKFFIQRPFVVDWSKPAVFTGIPTDTVPHLQEKSKKEQGQIISVEHRFMYAWTKPEPPDQAQLPEGLTLTVLKKEDAECICDHWKHYRTNPGLMEYFRQVVQHFDNSAITNSEGKLVAYICMQYNGSMANLFVDPEYHSLSLGVPLLCDLTRKLICKHHTAFGFIKTKDSQFIRTCQSIGFSWVPQGSMSWVHYSPPHTPGSRISTHSLSSVQEKDLFLNALPLSCNKCSGIPPSDNSGTCVHVGLN